MHYLIITLKKNLVRIQSYFDLPRNPLRWPKYGIGVFAVGTLYNKDLPMWIFVSFTDPVPCERLYRLSTSGYYSTTDLLQEVASLCRVKRRWLIARIKNETTNLRVCENWPMETYPFRNGSQLIVSIMDEGLAEMSPFRNKELAQIDEELELQIGSEISAETFSKSFKSSDEEWGKYLDESLEQFLNSVRKGSLQQVSAILKKEPQCENEQLIDSIMKRKVQHLTNGLGVCGRTALHWAIQDHNLQMTEFLLIKGCNPNTVSLDQYTPLQLAIAVNSMPIFETLAAHPKIDINLQSDKGSPLHLAIQLKSLVFAKKLIEYGADSQTVDSKGISPKQLAKSLQLVLAFQQRTPGKYQLPHILRGKIMKVSSFANRLKERNLLVNPFNGEMILYEGRQVDEKIELRELKRATRLNKTWSMKKDYWYFEVEGINKKLVFASHHEAICAQWQHQINVALRFVRDKRTPVRLEEQMVEALDDDKNQIRINKRKPPQTPSSQKQLESNPNKDSKQRKLSISLFDIKPSNDSEVGEEELRQSVLLGQKVRNEKIEKNELENSRKNSKEQIVETPISPQTRAAEGEDFRDSELLGSLIDSKIVHGLSPKRKDTFVMSTMAEETPTVCFGDFQILRHLGNGSFGKVFLARQKKSLRLFALKVLNKKKLAAKKQLKYAVTEATILKKLDHPFIVTLHYSFQTPSNLYLALDYCPHQDLSDLLYEEERLNEASCRFYIGQLILAIEYLHKNNILYRDLKPENILIGPNGYIRLADFNLSRQSDFSMSFCGSPAYLSPEMLEKKGVGFEADIYGIGCVLYQMLVGQPPYFDEELENLYANIREGKLKFPSALSKPAKSLILSLLQRDARKRLGSKGFDELKKHEFFKDFSWEQLEKQQMRLPEELRHRLEDELTTELEVIKDEGFMDTDYSSPQNMMNRVRNFTFVRR